MAVITVKFPDVDIKGESVLDKHEGESDAIAIRESIEIPPSRGSGRTKSTRTVGLVKFSDFEITRFKDQASPKLAEYCCAGKSLGKVIVNLFRTLETGVVPYMSYEMLDTFVSRLEYETLDEEGLALQPHMSDSATVAPPPSFGAGGLGFANLQAMKGSSRVSIRGISWGPKSSYTNQEVERIYLNASAVRWNYKQFENGRPAGTQTKAYNIQKGTEQA